MRVVIFGDSYVAAGGVLHPGYAQIVPLLLGAHGQRIAAGGTGFVKNSGDRPAYPSRLDSLLASGADLAIVQASGNDAVCDFGEVGSAAEEFLRATRTLPRVLVVGPMWAIAGRERLPGLAATIRDAAEAAEVKFVPALDWLTPHHIGSDGAHPNRRGHWRIACNVIRALRDTDERE